MALYMNRQTGEVMTRRQAEEEGKRLYDLFDPTNIFTFDDYYVKTQDILTPQEVQEVKAAIYAAVDETTGGGNDGGNHSLQ